MAAGSVLCLVYPAAGEGSAARTHQALAQEAGEQMQARVVLFSNRFGEL